MRLSWVRKQFRVKSLKFCVAFASHLRRKFLQCMLVVYLNQLDLCHERNGK